MTPTPAPEDLAWVEALAAQAGLEGLAGLQAYFADNRERLARMRAETRQAPPARTSTPFLYTLR